MEKIGIDIGEEDLSKIGKGIQASIDKLFERIELYSKIIAGPQFLNFEALAPCDLNESQDDDFIEQQAPARMQSGESLISLAHQVSS